MENLDWMVGRRIDVSFAEPTSWYFTFSDAGIITAECPWRLLKGGRIVLSSDDHQQRFGLPANIDAAAKATEYLSANEVRRAEVRTGTLDILLDFSGDFRLEIIPISSGFEAWKIADPLGQEVVAQGGGNLVQL